MIAHSAPAAVLKPGWIAGHSTGASEPLTVTHDSMQTRAMNHLSTTLPGQTTVALHVLPVMP